MTTLKSPKSEISEKSDNFFSGRFLKILQVWHIKKIKKKFFFSVLHQNCLGQSQEGQWAELCRQDRLWGRFLKIFPIFSSSKCLQTVLGQVRTGWKAERCCQAGQEAEFPGQGRLGGRALRLGQARGPSAAARAGQGAERCGQDGLGGRAPRLGQARGPILNFFLLQSVFRQGQVRLGQARGPSAAARMGQGAES